MTFRLLISNDGPSDNDYLSSLVHRAVEPKLSPWSNYKSAVNHVDFDQNFDPINPSTDSGGGRYTAQDGDTLQTVAAAVWGDAAMWYLLAEANGMTGDTQLAAGMSLIIPAKVANVHNNADTFRPYDPNKAIGDVSPTEMKPPERPKQGCGIVGMVLMVIIAAAVAYFATPLIGQMAAAFTTALGGGAMAGAVGGALAAAAGAAGVSVVSQGIGVALGIQDKFSWKQVGMAALTAGLTNGATPMPVTGVKFVDAALSQAVMNAGVQGVAVGIGLQDKFSWTQVAVAGVGAGVNSFLGDTLGGAATYDKVSGALKEPASFGHVLGRVGGESIARAGTRSLLTGTSFGDNIIAELPNAIGSTIGMLVSEQAQAQAYAKQQAAAKAQADAAQRQGAAEAARREAAINSDLVQYSPEERASMLPGTVQTVDVDASQPYFAEQAMYQQLADKLGLFSLQDRSGSTQALGYTGDFADVSTNLPQGISATGPFSDGWLDDQRRTLSFEGVVSALGRGLKREAREMYTAMVAETAERSINFALNNIATSPSVRIVLESFLTGEGPRDFYYGPNSAEVEEMFNSKPGGYFRREEIEAMRYMAYDSYKTGDLRDGYMITEHKFRSFHMDGLSGITDGAQMGDITGTLTSGISASVKDGMVHFRAVNEMDLASFAVGNVLPFAGNMVILPARGPLSTVTMTFEWSRPIPPYLVPKGR